MNYYSCVSVMNYVDGVNQIGGVDRREISISNVDISYLEKRFPEITFNIDYYIVKSAVAYSKNFFLRFTLPGVNRMNGSYTITSLEDEYYLFAAKAPYKMGAEVKYYLCDQLSGLVRCIQDIVYGSVNESIGDNYYYEMGDEEFISFCNMEFFVNYGDLEDLRKRLPFDIDSVCIIVDDSNKIGGSRLRLLYCGMVVFINIIPDDWYILSIRKIYDFNKTFRYKCDQLDGLLRCIDERILSI